MWELLADKIYYSRIEFFCSSTAKVIDALIVYAQSGSKLTRTKVESFKQ